jgi:hypothetical protein
MSTVSLSLPESLYKQVCKLAQEDGISLNQFIATAVAEKVAALMTVEYLRERAKQGSLVRLSPQGDQNCRLCKFNGAKRLRCFQ